MVGTGNGGWPELEFALMASGVPADQLYPIDIDRAFASYDKIKKDVVKWWDTGAVPIQLLTDREVVMTSVWNGRMAALQAAGAGWRNVVQFTTYLVHSQDIPKFSVISRVTNLAPLFLRDFIAL